MLAAALVPGFARREKTWMPAGRLRDLQEGVPTAARVRVMRQDGYCEAVDEQVVFLIKSGGCARAVVDVHASRVPNLTKRQSPSGLACFLHS